MTSDSLTIRIGGDAGMGLESSGAGFSKALTRGGLYVFGLPDYYSRIRGGHNFFSIRVSRQPLFSHAEPVHLLLALDMETVRRHVDAIVPGGVPGQIGYASVIDEATEEGHASRRHLQRAVDGYAHLSHQMRSLPPLGHGNAGQDQSILTVLLRGFRRMAPDEFLPPWIQK